MVVRYPGERRRSLGDLLDERVSLPGGGRAPLATVARITEVRDYAEQVRIDGRRAATVTAWFDGAATSAARVSAQVEEETLPTLLARLQVRTASAQRNSGGNASVSRWTIDQQLESVMKFQCLVRRSVVPDGIGFACPEGYYHRVGHNRLHGR